MCVCVQQEQEHSSSWLSTHPLHATRVRENLVAHAHAYTYSGIHTCANTRAHMSIHTTSAYTRPCNAMSQTHTCAQICSHQPQSGCAGRQHSSVGAAPAPAAAPTAASTATGSRHLAHPPFPPRQRPAPQRALPSWHFLQQRPRHDRGLRVHEHGRG